MVILGGEGLCVYCLHSELGFDALNSRLDEVSMTPPICSVPEQIFLQDFGHKTMV